MKSAAPSLIAATAMSMSPCPVISTTGIADPSSARRRTRSSPLIPGIRTSATTQSNRPPLLFEARKSSAVEQHASDRPLRDRYSCSESSTAASSSISATRNASTTRHLRRRQAEPHPRSDHHLVDKQLAAMRFDDRSAERESYPQAFGLGGGQEWHV